MDQIDYIKDTMVLPNGNTIRKTEKIMQDASLNLYREIWSKGIAIPYRDERCKSENEFILANPDGSEDLALLDPEEMENIIVRRIAEPGKGKYAHLIVRKSA